MEGISEGDKKRKKYLVWILFVEKERKRKEDHMLRRTTWWTSHSTQRHE
jgi:hypothetical protein